MSVADADHQVRASPLEEELLRARELEAVGGELLRAQEERVAWFKSRNRHRDQSELLLRIMGDTQQLHAQHVRLLEDEVRQEKSGWTWGGVAPNLRRVEGANRFLDDAAKSGLPASFAGSFRGG